MKKKVQKASALIRNINKLKSIMKRNKLTQTALAKILKVSQPCISSWLWSGKIDKKYFDKLISKRMK